MSIGAVFGKIQYAKKVFLENKHDLKQGKFIIGENARVFFHKSMMNEGRTLFPRSRVSFLQRLILKLLNVFPLFYVSSKGKKGNYTAIYIANNFDERREIKLFDFRSDKVLVRAKSNLDKKIKQIIFDTLHNVYNMPQIVDIPNDETRYLESRIYKKDLIRVELPFCAICMSHSRQPQGITEMSDSFKMCFEKPYEDYIENDESRLFIGELQQKISDEVKKIRQVYAIQHGDLSRDNLLYGYADGKEDFWWIDWEHLNLRPFYYDAFFFMVNSAVCDSDYTATNDYLLGKYDTCLGILFSAYGNVFLSHKRKEYLYLYMCDFTSERLCRHTAISALSQYRSYVSNYF